MATNAIDRPLGWFVLVMIAALVFLPTLTMSVGMGGMGPMMSGAWDHGMWGVNDGASGLLPFIGTGIQLLFVVLIIGASFLGYRAVTSEAGSTDSAVEELRTAYARGEIDDDAFERRRERLESGE